MLRHLAGDKKGIIPSNTSIRQIAVPISLSTMNYSKIGTKKPGRARFLNFSKVANNVAGVFTLIRLITGTGPIICHLGFVST
jgi:hypothetical protein